jgi:hypothetical protein
MAFYAENFAGGGAAAGCVVVQTQWVGGPPRDDARWGGGFSGQTAEDRHEGPVPQSALALELLAMASLRRGHWRVAAQRYLKLKLWGYRGSPSIAQTCEQHLAEMPKRDKDRMLASALNWVEMVGRVPSR